MTSQIDLVLDYMDKIGPITPVKAMHELRCYRLASVINRLRNRGCKIDTVMKRDYLDRPYAEYQLKN